MTKHNIHTRVRQLKDSGGNVAHTNTAEFTCQKKKKKYGGVLKGKTNKKTGTGYYGYVSN
jgi:hypothetical protein